MLIAIQSYWYQIFQLPKKVVNKIEAVCRTFLWTENTEVKKKALVAWSQLCLPKTAGGMNIADIQIWNKAAILKHYWNLSKKMTSHGLSGYILII